MRRALAVLVGVALATWPSTAGGANMGNRLENCGLVLEEVLNVPEDIPQHILDRAECVIVIPSVVKIAFVVGGSYGRGAMTCRGGGHFTGPWGAPTMIALEGGSVGFQLGGEATDFVILVTNPRGATAILKDKVKIGAGVSAAAGPKGRDAEADTDITLRAEMLTYSRARGLFAGISLEGSTLRPHNRANEDVYGKKVSATDIALKGVVPIPPAAQKFVAVLDKRSPRNNSDPNSLK
jgi:lipid-binding SYLF domain-containing protein